MALRALDYNGIAAAIEATETAYKEFRGRQIRSRGRVAEDDGFAQGLHLAAMMITELTPGLDFDPDHFALVAKHIEISADNRAHERSKIERSVTEIAFDDGIRFGLYRAAKIVRETIMANAPPPPPLLVN